MSTFVDIIIAALLTALVIVPISLLFGSTSDNGPLVLLIYALYGTVFVARGGRTPGKWLFELEVADVATGGKPTLRRAAVRAGVQIVAPFVASVLGHLLKFHNEVLSAVFDGLLIVASCAPPVSLLWASLRSVGKQAAWDKLSGTMVRYRTRRPPAI
jgi:uncharacterized RDD family membrane protein YckC